MATLSSTKASASNPHKHTDLEKQIVTLEQSVDALSKKVAALEAKPAAVTGSSDGVTRQEWSNLLKKLSSYIGFNMDVR